MPLFLDVNTAEEPVTTSDAAQAHAADVRTQGARGVSYLRYWVDEEAGKVSSLVAAPSADAAADVHREAHGMVAQEIYQVTEGGH